MSKISFKRLGIKIAIGVALWLVGYGAFLVHVTNLRPASNLRVTDAIVVLTGGSNRIDQGLQLFAQGKSPQLFISGVFEDTTKNDITKRWNGEMTLPPCCITLGQEARSTIGNAAETKAWLESHGRSDIILVTANFHMPRALMEFKNALPDARIQPHPVKQPDVNFPEKWFWFITFVEYNKLLVRWASLLLPLPASFYAQQ